MYTHMYSHTVFSLNVQFRNLKTLGLDYFLISYPNFPSTELCEVDKLPFCEGENQSRKQLAHAHMGVHSRSKIQVLLWTFLKAHLFQGTESHLWGTRQVPF